MIIGTGSKDFWSMSQPINDSQFANYDLDPLLAGFSMPSTASPSPRHRAPICFPL